MTDPIAAAGSRGILLLDAAMGTRLMAHGLDLRTDDAAFWNLERPGIVLEVHLLDVAAGSEAILTNTFGANRAWLARYGRADSTARLNRLGVALAREAAGPDRFVIGSIGPTSAADPKAPLEQAEVLAEAGIDALLLETFHVEQATVALRSIGDAFPLPRLVSLASWPDDIVEAARMLEDLGAGAIGSNCQDGMGAAMALAASVRAASRLPLIVKPAANLPGSVAAGPGSFAAAVPALRRLGPVLVGGCCGTDESYVAALREACYPGADAPRPQRVEGPRFRRLLPD